MMAGPLAVLVLAGIVVVFDPLVVMGRSPALTAERLPGIPAHSPADHPPVRPRLRARGPVEHCSRTPQRR